MNILIDYTQIPINRAGAGAYAYNLIKQLSLLDRMNVYFIIIQNDDIALDNFKKSNIVLLKVNHKYFRIFILRFLLEQLYLPYLIIKNKIDIIHSLHYSFPLIRFRAKRLITIHDMTFFLMPEVHVRFKIIYFRTFIRLATLMKSHFISVSESTKNDFIRITKVNSNNCTVIPLGKSQIYNTNYSLNDAEKVKAKYNIDKEFILFIGTIEPRKNIKTIITAFYEFNKNCSDYLLVIIGKTGWYYEEIFQMINDYKITGKVIFTGFVLEEEKPILLSACKLFIYPSLYEGFGIPIIEAMACGAPVITSNISSMPEVAGNAAILVNPTDVNEILFALNSLTKDNQLIRKLKKDALINASKYTWERTAELTIKKYNSISN